MRRLSIALTAALLVACGLARAAEPPELVNAPGYVDGSAFLALSTEDSELVEISIKGALLQALAQGFPDSETSSMFAKLKGISAVIAGPNVAWYGPDRRPAGRSLPGPAGPIRAPDDH